MQKGVPHRKDNQKRKSIGDIHLHHQHQAHLMTILMRVKIEKLKATKTQILDLG